MSLLALLVAVLLVVGNGLFVAAEFALLSAQRAKLEPLAEAGGRSGRRTDRTLAAMGALPVMLAATQLGVTLCSLGLGAVAEPAVAGLLDGLLTLARLPHALLHPVSYVVALALVTAAHTVLGEMVPKNVALAGPERTALWLGPALATFARVSRPLLSLLTAASRAVLRLVRVPVTDEITRAYDRQEFGGVLAESRAEGLLGEEELKLLTGALELGERTAASVLVPADRVVSVPRSVTPRQLEAVVARDGHSRYPVRPRAGLPERVARRGPVADRGRPLRGAEFFVHAKDLLELTEAERDRPLPAGLLRRALRARPETTLSALLVEMRRARSHLALVEPRGGGPLGIVTMEDVLTALVGNIRGSARP